MSACKNTASWDISVHNTQLVEGTLVPNIQLVEIFQYKTFSQYEYSSTKHWVSTNIPVQNIQSSGIFQYKIVSQYVHYGTKLSSQQGDISVQNIHSVGMFQYSKKEFNMKQSVQ